ncbi:serine/threonine protein kinase [Candidatus Woesearchaeota archaeon]|nr:serine/threonine protein kinase [Candidatus Woesearchaeota archaeon]
MGNTSFFEAETKDPAILSSEETEEEKIPLDELIDKLNKDFFYHDPPLVFDGYIGKGSFGHVFKGISHYDTLEEHAIKIMKPQLLDTPNPMDLKDLKKFFMNECVFQYFLSQQLEDKVVKVYDYGEFLTYRFMVMELMSDKSLRHVINDYRSYSLKDRVSIMIDIAGILSEIHEKRIVHRDVKPENALFSRKTYIVDGEHGKEIVGERVIKMSDFGLVRWMHSHFLPEQNKIIGSSDYMSPEQVHEPKYVDKRTDIFSFGVVFYEMLNGVYPRQVDIDTDDEYRYLSTLVGIPARAIIDLNDTVKDLNYIIMKCMEKDPEKRYQSMGEVLVDLREYYNKQFDA